MRRLRAPTFGIGTQPRRASNASAVKLLAEEGFCLDPTSPTFLRVQQILHRAMIEPSEGNSRVSFPATGLLPV